jgi:CRP/FNR family transcriptional regulator, anaerobic regulatory protein
MSKRRSCSVCAVRHRALCGATAKEELPRINRVASQRRYDAGQFIIGAGQPQDWFATVLSGVVKLTKTMSDGRQQIVGLLCASDFLGRPFGSASPYGAEAATAVELCCVERHYFEDLLLNSPDMKQLILERTLNEVDAAREWMLVLGRKTAEEKVASLILLMTKRACLENASGFRPLHYDLPLSRTEMAEYLGLRIETVSRQIRRLRTAGVIETDNGRAITILDIGRLGQMAGRESPEGAEGGTASGKTARV